MKTIKLMLLVSIVTLLNSCKKDDTIVQSITPIATTIDSSKISLNDSFKIVKSGTFAGQGGYPVSGTVELGKNLAGKSVVHLGKNFDTAVHTGSVALYLSKNKSLAINDATTFIRFGSTSVIGEQYFGLNETPTDEYKFVIVWCAPVGVQFGSADLK